MFERKSIRFNNRIKIHLVISEAIVNGREGNRLRAAAGAIFSPFLGREPLIHARSSRNAPTESPPCERCFSLERSKEQQRQRARAETRCFITKQTTALTTNAFRAHLNADSMPLRARSGERCSLETVWRTACQYLCAEHDRRSHTTSKNVLFSSSFASLFRIVNYPLCAFEHRVRRPISKALNQAWPSRTFTDANKENSNSFLGEDEFVCAATVETENAKTRELEIEWNVLMI